MCKCKILNNHNDAQSIEYILLLCSWIQADGHVYISQTLHFVTPHKIPVIPMRSLTKIECHVGVMLSCFKLHFLGSDLHVSVGCCLKSSWCYLYSQRGTIMHEFGHAAGFAHEHSRADRDADSVMLYGNIQSGREANFDKQAYGQGLVFENAPYDAGSVMHYSTTVSTNNVIIKQIVQNLVVRCMYFLKYGIKLLKGAKPLSQCCISPLFEWRFSWGNLYHTNTILIPYQYFTIPIPYQYFTNTTSAKQSPLQCKLKASIDFPNL